MANNSQKMLFKSGISDWAARILILIVIIPSLGLFGISMANPSAAAGYYGIDPPDVQFTMTLYYAGVVSFYSLEMRLFNYFKIRDYFLLSVIAEIITSLVCYYTHNLSILFIFRFLQGAASGSGISVCITLIFSRLHNERTREIGYSVLYGLLLVVSQLTTFFTAPIIYSFDYNILYKIIIYLYIPGSTLLYFSINNIRTGKKIPLKQLDWSSVIIYATAVSSFGFVLTYGQEYDWFENNEIILSAIICVFTLIVFFVRQYSLHRPYINLNVFKYRNFIVGCLLLFVLYLCRGGLNITTFYFTSVLGLDYIHLGDVLLVNVAGVLIGVLVSSRLILLKIDFKRILFLGFAMMLSYYVVMTAFFTIQANIESFFIPLLIQGIGAGLLMVPIIIFMISSVPPDIIKSASGFGVFVRFVGFSSSLAIINAFTVFSKQTNYNRFLNQLTPDNEFLKQRINLYESLFKSKGVLDNTGSASQTVLAKAIDKQLQIRLSIEYYEYMSILIAVILFFIMISPFMNRTKFRKIKTLPASVGI